MLIVGFKGVSLHPDDAIVRAILARRIGGVILFAHNVENPAQLVRLTQQLQGYAAQAGLAPLLIGIDYEGGKVNRLKESVGFPKTVSAATFAQSDVPQMQQYAEQMAQTLAQAGVNINFAPVVDVNVNPNNPVIGLLERSFSVNSQQVIDCAALFVAAHRRHGVLCAYKHFPGHGSSTKDTHKEFVDITETWHESELLPYRQLLLADVGVLVMIAHVVHRGLDKLGYPASISAAVIQGLLRDTLKFTGVVVTDDLQMKAVADHYGVAEAVRLAVNASADLLVFGNQLVSVPQDPERIIEMIDADVMAGRISQAQIEAAYQRIMRMKQRIGSRLENA